MNEVTKILNAIEHGDPTAADELLPLVYAELKKLASSKMAREKSGQTLQATALVHEAYLRLVDVENSQKWDSRRHFFAAAAESMRRILVENARRKGRLKRGGDRFQVPLADVENEPETSQLDLIALDEALRKLAEDSPEKAEIVQLRFFAGLNHDEVAEMLGVSTVTIKRRWRYARAWLLQQISGSEDSSAE